ncbi:MAG: DUF262 domain-containing protein [Bryobacteraceae bacterium]|jgi:hypothetical protein
MEYTPKKFSTEDLVAAWKDGSLKINEEYQRGASWTQAQMQGLIDSIFRQYPIPPIFLHQIRAKGLGGLESTRYEICRWTAADSLSGGLPFGQVSAAGGIGQEAPTSEQPAQAARAVGQAAFFRTRRLAPK